MIPGKGFVVGVTGAGEHQNFQIEQENIPKGLQVVPGSVCIACSDLPGAGNCTYKSIFSTP